MTRETHIVNNLKIKIFIKINVCDLEKINIYISKKILHIKLYKINVFILFKTRANNPIRQIAIFIYYKNIPPLYVSIYPKLTGIFPISISQTRNIMKSSQIPKKPVSILNIVEKLFINIFIIKYFIHVLTRPFSGNLIFSIKNQFQFYKFNQILIFIPPDTTTSVFRKRGRPRKMPKT